MSEFGIAFGRWMVYLDIPLPFTKRVLVLDFGRRVEVGWRLRREGTKP